jgi:hypothetical protein
MAVTGRCLCGSVAYTVDGPLREVWNCHCHRCRRFTGHHMAATAAAPADLRFSADETLAWYSPDTTVEYGFCNRCGSSLFWRRIQNVDHISICAGTLDSPTGLSTTRAWWVAEASDYHARPAAVTEYLYED